MAFEDDETLKMFIEESQEHLSDIEDDLLEIESQGANIDAELVNKVFRAVHSIKGGAGFFGLDQIKSLGHDMENVLNLIRKRELVPTLDVINVLLDSADLLNEMINDAAHSNEVDITASLAALSAIGNTPSIPTQKAPSRTNNASENDQEIPQIHTPSDPAIPEQTTNDLQSTHATPQSHLPFSIDTNTIQEAQDQYEYFYLVTYHTEQDFQNKNRSPQEVHQELQLSGAVLGSTHDFDADILENGQECKLLFATVIEPSFIAVMLDLEPDQIQQISEQELTDTPHDSPTTEAPPKETQAHQEQAETLPSDTPLPKSETPIAETPITENTPQQSHHKTPTPENTLRVGVDVLDQLMNLAGELVLTRNRLMQLITAKDHAAIDQSAQHLDVITSELQEAIMSTRMQPIGLVFTKFRRIVRDLARDLNKNIQLIIEGEEVELDKTIIEALSDPLTHLVRNAIDHGIETTAERDQTDKPAQATLKLCATHEAGQVVIEISDDGKGIDPEKIKSKALESGLHDPHTLATMSHKDIIRLIFAPGFSTAQAVSDISGRGIGMDVVRTNITQLGGVIDIDSSVGKGTTIRIKLPLTLAIIPCLLVSTNKEHYAIPQVNVSELVRISSKQKKGRIQKIGDAQVLSLRNTLLPLISLNDLVGVPTHLTTQETNCLPNATNIVVVTTGTFQYGLIVDQLLDSEEIVVKPLDRHLNNCKTYAGATIQGDGSIALILDVVEMGHLLALNDQENLIEDLNQNKQHPEEVHTDAQSLVLVKNAPEEQFAIPLGLISRIERIHKSQIENMGGRRTMTYRNNSLVLFAIEDVAQVKPCDNTNHLFVIIFSVGKREVGLLVSQIVDILNTTTTIDQVTFCQQGVLGSILINNNNTLLIDLFGIVEAVTPEWITKSSHDETQTNAGKTILIVEDSPFFLSQLTSIVKDAGYQVLTATDGHLALDIMQHPNNIDLILTDIEMPNMDGLELARSLRAQNHDTHLPIIAVTSVSGEAAEKRGLDAGIDAYLIKLDREQILNTMAYHLNTSLSPVDQSTPK